KGASHLSPSQSSAGAEGRCTPEIPGNLIGWRADGFKTSSRAAASGADSRWPQVDTLLHFLPACTIAQTRWDLQPSSPNLPSHEIQQLTHATPQAGRSERVQRSPALPS